MRNQRDEVQPVAVGCRQVAPYEAAITVRFDLPWLPQAYAMRVMLDIKAVRAISPLPVDHDSPFDLQARAAAMRQVAERKETVAHVLQNIERHLWRLIEESDPQNGKRKEQTL